MHTILIVIGPISILLHLNNRNLMCSFSLTKIYVSLTVKHIYMGKSLAIWTFNPFVGEVKISLDMERLTVDTDTSPDTGEYFFNLYYSSLPEIEGVSRFNNLINSLSGSVSFGLPFLCRICGVYVPSWRYRFHTLRTVLTRTLNFFATREKNSP